MVPRRVPAFPVGAVAALPLLLLALAVLWRDFGDKQAQIARDHEARAHVAALSTEAFVSNNLSTVRSLAATFPVVLDGDVNTSQLFDHLIAENPDWQGASIVGADGWNVASSTS